MLLAPVPSVSLLSFIAANQCMEILNEECLPSLGDKAAGAAQPSGAVAAKPNRVSSAVDETGLPPLPPEKSIQQTMELNGKTLHYTVTVGAFPIRDKANKVVGQVVVTSYTMPGENRPVTFAINGGPGGSSVYLNFGAIGPKHLQFGNAGDSP